MPVSDEVLMRLPDLISGMLLDLSLAFRKANSGTLAGLGFAEGPVFKMGDSEVQMRGRMAQSEGNKIFFFPAEQEEKGAEFAVRLPVRVEHPPEDTPWQLAMGLLVFDEGTRRKVYRAAIKAMTFVSLQQIGAAPVWRVGPGEYLVTVPGESLKGALVTIDGSRTTGKALASQEALEAIMVRLTTILAGKYAAVLGKITE